MIKNAECAHIALHSWLNIVVCKICLLFIILIEVFISPINCYVMYIL